MKTSGIIVLALAGLVSVAATLYGSGKSSEKEITVEGTVSGLDCFLEGELCAPDHFWKKGEVAGLVTEGFQWHYLSGSKAGNGIPRDVLGKFFLGKVRVKGTLYEEVVTFLRPEMESWQDGKWSQVWSKGSR